MRQGIDSHGTMIWEVIPLDTIAEIIRRARKAKRMTQQQLGEACGLEGKTAEPLTGRKFEYRLLPLSFQEMVSNTGLLTEKQFREQRLLYGTYPDILTHPEDSERLLSELVNSYLFKDIYALEGLKRTKILDNLVKALAMQVGSEVNLNELSGLVGVDRKTVETYIDLLEKNYVVFSLPAYSGNMRNEIKKGKKIYYV